MSARGPASRVAIGAVATLLATVPFPFVRADDAPSVARRCIDVDRIDQTRIVDNRSILFFMRDRTVLQNVLPKPCQQLRAKDRLKYDVVLGKLCANDFVTQLIDLGSYAPGAVCAIGMFVPISNDEARALLPSKKRQRERSTAPHAIEAKPAEPPAAR